MYVFSSRLYGKKTVLAPSDLDNHLIFHDIIFGTPVALYPDNRARQASRRGTSSKEDVMKRMLMLLALVFVMGTAGAYAAGPANGFGPAPYRGVSNSGWNCPGGGPGWGHGYGSGMYGPRAGWHGRGQGHGYGRHAWGAGPHGPGYGMGYGQGYGQGSGMGPGAR